MVFSITKMKKDKYKYVALELKRAGKFLKKNKSKTRDDKKSN